MGVCRCGALYDATFVAAMADVAKCMASNLDKRMLPLMARIQVLCLIVHELCRTPRFLLKRYQT